MWYFIKFIFITCLLSVFTALYLLGTTTAGLQYDLQWLTAQLPGKLSVKKVEGTLLSGFTLHDFSYQGSNQQITFKLLDIRWNPFWLLKGKFDISQLNIQNGYIILSTKNEISQESHLIRLLQRMILHHLAIKNLFIKQSSSTLELNGDLTDHWDLRWKLHKIDLKEWSSNYSGYLNSEGTLSGSLSEPILRTTFNANHLIFSGQSIPEIKGEAELSLKKSTLAAHINLKPLDIHVISPNSMYFKNPHGKISANLDIHGTLLNPIVTGEFTIDNANFSIPSLGIHPEGIFIRGNLTADNIINLQGRLQSGAGKARFDGTINLNQDHYPMTVSLQGDRLSAVKLSEYKILISPDVKIQLTYPLLTLQGKVLIPFAEIKPKNFSGTTSLPEEVVYVQQKKIITTPPWDTILDIDLKLGEEVNVHYSSLEALLGGSIHLTKEAYSQATAQGEFYARQGRYVAYGQKLMIENGRLTYTGNTLTNPGLAIEAVKKVRRVVTNNSDEFTTRIPLYAGTEYIKVGLRVYGTADKPKISLFSIPSDLSQADILSYIILGQPQSNVSNTQGAAILSMLTTLNPNGTKISHYTEKLQEMLGLSELNIESVQNFNPNSKSVEATTSFVIGKQITKKLSLHYSIGLFDPISVLNLRYQIDNHWALQSETSTVDNGADLFYVFERD